MSTIDYPNPLGGKPYKIGTIGWAAPKNFSQIFDALVPTYGLWAGPGYAGGKRVLSNKDIEWKIDPCKNNSIMGSGAVPDNCFSLVDAITKEHDWDYYQAESNGNDPTMIMSADLEMLKSIFEEYAL